MARRLLNLLTALSLLLCVAVVTLWVRSCWARDRLAYARSTPRTGRLHVFELTTGGGVLLVSVSGFNSSRHVGKRGIALETGEPENPAHWVGLPTRLGFGLETYDSGAHHPLRVWYWLLAVPLWLPAAMLALGPAARLHRRGRRRCRTGLCTACDYDLRATPDRCPECGTMPPASPADRRGGGSPYGAGGRS
jgi:hypothetical protein